MGECMKKLLFILFILLPVLLLSWSYIYRVPLLEKGLTMAFCAPVKVGSLEFDKEGIVVEGLKISNPVGSTLKHALVTKKIDIRMDYKKSLTSRKLVIQSVEVDHALMTVELFNVDGSDSNWSRLIEALAAPSPIPISINFEIDVFRMRDIRLQAFYHAFAKGKLRPDPIKEIVLKNLGTDRPMSMHDFMGILAKVLLNEAASSLDLKTLVPAYLLQHFIPIPIFQIQQAGKFIQGMFENDNTDDDNN